MKISSAGTKKRLPQSLAVAQEPALGQRDFMLKPVVEEKPMAARTLEEIEKAHILLVLEECGGNRTRAAERLDIDRVTLYNKLKRYGWKKPKKTTTAS